MYKLKNSYIDKMIESQPTSKEIDFLLYISKFQDEFGVVYSVYYKNVCDSIGISVQKFYDILESLSFKRLISVKKINSSDYCVTLIGNNFIDKDFSKGYLNVAGHKFQSNDFLSLKAGSKLLYLYLQRFTAGRHMLLDRFYDEFCALFQCAKKTLQEYLRQLKNAYFVISKVKRSKAYNYEMCLKNGNSLKLNKSEKILLQTENSFYKDNIMQLISCNFKRFLPRQPKSLLEDVSELALTRFDSESPSVPLKILSAVKNSISVLLGERKKKPILNAALVNKCLSELIV